jgi:uncharacterized protein YceK
MLALALAAALLVGCASPRTLNEDTRAHIVERATARWEALAARDYATAWEYTSPAYPRSFLQSAVREQVFLHGGVGVDFRRIP